MPKTLNSRDFYMRLGEFRYWLKETHMLMLFDLSLDQAQTLFKRDFIKEWNSGQLHPKYYQETIEDSDPSFLYDWSTNQSAAEEQISIDFSHTPSSNKLPAASFEHSESLSRQERKKRLRDEYERINELVPSSKDSEGPTARARDKRKMKAAMSKRDGDDRDLDLDSELINDDSNAEYHQLTVCRLAKYHRLEEERNQRRQKKKEEHGAALREKYRAHQQKEQQVIGQLRSMLGPQ